MRSKSFRPSGAYGQITNNVRLQDARLQQLLVDHQNTVWNAQQQVDNGLSTFLQSRYQVGFLRSSALAANGALNIALDQLRPRGHGFHHRAYCGAKSLPSGKQPGRGDGKRSPRPHCGVSRARRRMADLGRQLFRGCRNQRADARAHQLGNPAAAPANEPQPPAPGLPGPNDIGPTVRPPEW
jgi:hypothetical protein